MNSRLGYKNYDENNNVNDNCIIINEYNNN